MVSVETRCLLMKEPLHIICCIRPRRPSLLKSIVFLAFCPAMEQCFTHAVVTVSVTLYSFCHDTIRQEASKNLLTRTGN